ncbi:hypothetical protein GCM10020220_082540 [Nonomuraea rubra]
MGRGGVHHRVEHLGGDDDRAGLLAAELDDPPLHDRDLLQRQLDAEVAAGDHDAVERLDDVGEAVDGLRLLDLGEQREADGLLLHDVAHHVGVGRAADEGQGDHVEAGAQRPAQVGLVLVGERRGADVDARQVEALVVGDHAADDDAGDDALAVDAGGLQHEAAVVDEDRVTGADVLGQPLVGGGDLLAVARHVFGGDGEDVAEAQPDGAFLERADTDLGALQVGEHAYTAAEVGRHRLDPVVNLSVQVMIAMAEVEPCHVHARGDQLAEAFFRGCGGA